MLASGGIAPQLTSALDRGEFSPSYPQGTAPSTHCIGGWEGLGVSLG
jgi:hypothetical protein